MTRRTAVRRTGAVTVEFALVVPLVFLFFWASYEFCRLNMLRHTVDIAAYEGARRAMVPGATAADARQRAEQFLTPAGALRASILVTPETLLPETGQVTVDITLPLDDNAWLTPMFLGGRQVRGTATLLRENVRWLPPGAPAPPAPLPPVPNPSPVPQ